MHLRSYTKGRWLWLALVGSLTQPLIAQTPVDTTAALAALQEFQMLCRQDGGRLWGQSLCGPEILVDRQSRIEFFSERPSQTTVVPRDGFFVGSVPGQLGIANTSVDWDGRSWSMVVLPLGNDSLERRALLVHEAYHRVQDALGLSRPDRMNQHLDTRQGREWLRLELRALARALESRGRSRDRAAKDAMIFRSYRRQLFPGADSLEDALEFRKDLPSTPASRLPSRHFT